MKTPSAEITYNKMKETSEFLQKLFELTFVKMTLPGVMAPNLLLSYYTYFFSDVGIDSFKLPFITWLVIVFGTLYPIFIF